MTLLENFVNDNPPLEIRKRTLHELQADPEYINEDLNVYKIFCLFCGELDNFEWDRYERLRNQIILAHRDAHPDVSMKAIHDYESFGCDYIDPHGSVQSFATFVMECSNSFYDHSMDFESPYVSIVQSSMYGKSRLIREIVGPLPDSVCLSQTQEVRRICSTNRGRLRVPPEPSICAGLQVLLQGTG